MPQLTLFDSVRMSVIDEERGRVVYTPRFVDAATAEAWFSELRAVVPWHAERRMMYDRDVAVPRLMGHFRLDSIPAAAPAAILDAASRVGGAVGVSFTSVGLNLYRDGRDSVAPHGDHLDEIRKGFPIALLSLGATRRMTIRLKEPPRSAVHVDLEPGSLLVMDYASQLYYTHAVPKTAAHVGERISLAFRVKRPHEGPGDGAGDGVYR